MPSRWMNFVTTLTYQDSVVKPLFAYIGIWQCFGDQCQEMLAIARWRKLREKSRELKSMLRRSNDSSAPSSMGGVTSFNPAAKEGCSRVRTGRIKFLFAKYPVMDEDNYQIRANVAIFPILFERARNSFTKSRKLSWSGKKNSRSKHHSFVHV